MRNLINKIKDKFSFKTPEDIFLAELADLAVAKGGRPDQSFLEVVWDEEDKTTLKDKKTNDTIDSYIQICADEIAKNLLGDNAIHVAKNDCNSISVAKNDRVRKKAKIKIKYLPGATKMKKVEKGDLIDCYAYETVELKKGESALINLGFACELPQGYEAHLYPRSSTFKNFKVLMTNSVGLIDSSFRGDGDVWKMAVYAVEDTIIKAGERPCQFRIMECQPDIEFEEVDSLNNEERGGFGSSGR